MRNYIIRKAEYDDLEEIERIYAFARAYMQENGNPTQWGKENPSRERILEDIRLGQLYAVVDCGRLCGVFAFAVGEDPTYVFLEDGNWRFRETYGTIHRLAGNGNGGVFNACLHYCLERQPYIRIDTHENNKPMRHLIMKAGFCRCGIIHVSDGSPRIAYDLKRK